MFDTVFRQADDAAVLAAIEEWAVAECAAAAHRLAAIAELTVRRFGDDERAGWACDGWDAAAAEISAALAVSQHRASALMDLGLSLRERLPAVAALFMAGRVHPRVVDAIAWRTALVRDTEVMATLDAVIAELAGKWNALSQFKLEQAIDALVDQHDPGALRRTRSDARSRGVTIGAENPAAGTASLWGRLFASDAAILQRRLSSMAREVCDDDPRTIAQRRADALGALAAGAQRLACQCGRPECPSADPDARAGSVVVHVVADPDAVAAQPDPAMSGECTPDSDADEPAQPGTAVLVGSGMLPAPLLAELIRAGATVRHLGSPPRDGEPQYRPSTALDEFVRMRDMTCRFPGCDRPAEFCDVDHTVPWPFGPTHASNLSCKCRKHHLLKTFWDGGPQGGGWTDRQYPDGTIVWTSPTGRTYTTRPGCHLLFPTWSVDTGPVPGPSSRPASSPHRGLQMPARRRTRAAERAYRIACERALNDARVAERNRPPPF